MPEAVGRPPEALRGPLPPAAPVPPVAGLSPAQVQEVGLEVGWVGVGMGWEASEAVWEDSAAKRGRVGSVSEALRLLEVALTRPPDPREEVVGSGTCGTRPTPLLTPGLRP